LQFDWGHWKEDDYKLFFAPALDDNIHAPLVDSIINLVQTRNFSGLVIEWGFVDTSQIIHIMKPFLRELYMRLHFNQVIKQLFLVIPPYREQQQTFNANHYVDLLEVIDRFCVMTYDYSGGRPAPNAPLNDFVIPTIDYYVSSQSNNADEREERASKLLLGINFYGYDYQFTQQKVEALVGHQYREYMDKYKPQLNWDAPSAEHWMDFVDDKKNQHRVFYPTVKSIKRRLDVAQEKKIAGIMIWEAGQGLDEFLAVL
jgi:spore germination protein YaaH